MLDNAFLSAAQQLDGESMRAFLTGPGGPWIQPDTLERADEMYGQRRNPEAWSNFQSLGVYLEHVTGLANFIGLSLLAWRAEPRAVRENLAIEVPDQPSAVPSFEAVHV
jgi:hypothetical protein